MSKNAAFDAAFFRLLAAANFPWPNRFRPIEDGINANAVKGQRT